MNIKLYIMKTRKLKLMLVLLLFSTLSWGGNGDVPSRLSKNEYGHTILKVDGVPMLMVCGELHNSSASTPQYMNKVLRKLTKLNLNSVLATVAWEDIEPKEGQFDFSLVDSLMAGAYRNGLRVGILWFGSWKNGESSYAPEWVKRDTKRFQRVISPDGKPIEILSPFCEATMRADSKAFAALMAHIRENDIHKTVIIAQPENEVGIFQDMDYSKMGKDALKQQVPNALTLYLKKNEKRLKLGIAKVWRENGKKNTGTWEEVFGNGYESKAYCTVWQYASYINHVAEAGKAEYPLPMYCNCWLVQKEEDLPGVYPNGGPVDIVMDIWKAAAPAVDFLSPDIYLPNFKSLVADYYRYDNPLFIPEVRMNHAWAMYAFGQYGAMGFSPFGIEDRVNDKVYAGTSLVVKELAPLITKYAGSSKMVGLLNDSNASGERIEMGKYVLDVAYENKNEGSCYGIVIQTDDDEFIVAGAGLKITFNSSKKGIGYIMRVSEGGFEQDGTFVVSRNLNGDETNHNKYLVVKGREVDSIEQPYGTYNKIDPSFYTPTTDIKFFGPGIYKVSVYIRSEK